MLKTIELFDNSHAEHYSLRDRVLPIRLRRIGAIENSSIDW